MLTKNINFCITFTIFSFLVGRCVADCDVYGNHCDYKPEKRPGGVLYGIAFGLTAIVAVGVALCCVHCDCCPYYRGRRRTHQTLVSSPHVAGVSNGISVGPPYTYPTGQAGNSSYPVQPTYPAPYNQQQYHNQQPYPPQNPPLYGLQP